MLLAARLQLDGWLSSFLVRALALILAGCCASSRAHVEHVAPNVVTLRSATQSVTFTRRPQPQPATESEAGSPVTAAAAEFLLTGTEVLQENQPLGAPAIWTRLFDVPTPIVAGSAQGAWALRPTAVTVTRNDSAASCVNFTGSGSSGSFWIGVCLDSASDGLVRFDASLRVAPGTQLGPGPEPQIVLRRHANATVSLDQGPLSIYHNPAISTNGESAVACGAGVGAGALGHGVGFPAAYARWDAAAADAAADAAAAEQRGEQKEAAPGARRESDGVALEAAVFFNMTASTWFSRAGHGRFGSSWVRSTEGAIGAQPTASIALHAESPIDPSLSRQTTVSQMITT
jgi:hypothetical protein